MYHPFETKVDGVEPVPTFGCRFMGRVVFLEVVV